MGNNEGTGFDFKLMLDFFAQTGEKNDQNHKELMGMLKNPVPTRPLVGGVAITSGASPFVLGPTGNVATGPAAGLLWNIRTIGIYGVDGHTAVSGVTGVDLYAGDIPDAGGATDPPAASFSDLISAGIVTLPTFQTYSRHAIWCKHGEVPYAMVYGLGAGIQLVFVSTVEQWRMQDAEAMSI